MMFPMLSAHLHQIDPFAIYWGGTLLPGIRWYGLSFFLGFILGFLMVRWIVSRGPSTVAKEQVLDLIVFVALGVMIGGRLGYCLFYSPALLTQFEASFPFWGVLNVGQGGMSSHGGMIGAIIASWLYARRWGHRFSHILDLIAFATPLGLMLGRAANFINGELYGRQAPDNFPLAVKFPQEMMTWPARPERADDLASLQPVFEQIAPAQAGIFQQIQITIAEIQAGNPEVIAAVEPLLTPRYPSQIFAGITEGLITMIVLLLVWRKPRPPLMIAGAFACSYAVMRIVNEFFREPDFAIRDQEFAMFALTRGQLLSLGLLAVGVGMIYYAIRSKAEPLGGRRALPTQTAAAAPEDSAPPKAAPQAQTPASPQASGRQKPASTSKKPPRSPKKRK